MEYSEIIYNARLKFDQIMAMNGINNPELFDQIRKNIPELAIVDRSFPILFFDCQDYQMKIKCPIGTLCRDCPHKNERFTYLRVIQ